MRTAAPVASVLVGLALGGAIVWQAVNMWRQPSGGFTLPKDLLTSAQRARQPEAASAPEPVERQAPGPPPSSASTQERVQASAPPRANAPVVDETALRYFARQGDTRRLNAEITRLRSIYPDWSPPADPLQAPPVADPQLDNMWRLYAQGHYAEARAAIAARQSADAKWTPPKDLIERLDLADTRERLINASDAKQYGVVIQLAASTPDLRTCGDVDVLWRVAEAFAASDRDSRAVDAYRYILTNCTNANERLATMQKASTLLPRSALDDLLALGHGGPEGDEFQSVREDIARREVAAAGAAGSAKVSDADIAVLEKAASRDQSPTDPLLLGWYWLRHDDVVKAEQWFRTSFDRKKAAEAAEGLSLALIELKRPADAEAILAPWREEAAAQKTYLAAISNLLSVQPPPVIAPEVLSRIVETIAKQRDATGAQLLGWYSRAYRQDETAARWFATGLAWNPNDEPSAYGLAITDFSLNRRAALAALQRVWSSRSLRIAALTDVKAARALASAASPGQASPGAAPVANAAPPSPSSAVTPPMPSSTFSPPIPPQATSEPQSETEGGVGTTPVAAERRSGSSFTTSPLSEAWRLSQLDRPAEAAEAFRKSLSTGPESQRADAAYGLALTYLRLGLPIAADNAAALAPQSDVRSRDLRLSILTERIRKAYDGGHYDEALVALDSRAALAAESVDLMTLRGWSYYHLQRYEEAMRIFQALADAGHEGALDALYTAKSASKNWKD
jgi:cellulose synthase operon protein C